MSGKLVKHLLTIALATTLCVGIIPSSAWAVDGTSAAEKENVVSEENAPDEAQKTTVQEKGAESATSLEDKTKNTLEAVSVTETGGKAAEEAGSGAAEPSAENAAVKELIPADGKSAEEKPAAPAGEEKAVEGSTDPKAEEETTAEGGTEPKTEEETKKEVGSEPKAEEETKTEGNTEPKAEETKATSESKDEDNKEKAADEKAAGKEEVKKEVKYPAFAGKMTVDGVVVSVAAPEGAFPEGAVLSVKKIDNKEQKKVDVALDTVRKEARNVAASYTFDIKVLDKAGKELQPAKGKVKVSFTLAKIDDSNLETQVYHIAETEQITAKSVEELKVETKGETASVETKGFSYYTVEFTYNDLQYVMEGDSAVALTDILKKVGLSGTVSKVEVSNSSLFAAENASGKWVVRAKQAFASTEWMKVTIDGVVYEIVVTDAIPGDNVTGDPNMNAGETKEGDFTITTGPVRGPQGEGTATIKNGTVTNNATNGYKGGVSSSSGSAFIARGAESLKFDGVTINTNNKSLIFNIWANSSITANNTTLDGENGTWGANDPFLLVGGYPQGGAGTLNFTGTSYINSTTGAIAGGNNNSEINVSSGTLTIADSSDIKLNNGIKINVNSGATLKLNDDSKITGTINVKSGGILDISDSNVYSLDNLPSNVSLEANAIIKVNEYPINEVVVNNGESATIDSEGNITKEPPYGDQTKTIQGKTVKVRAQNYKIKEDAPITVNNGGKLYFDNVNLDDKHAITINNGGKAYLKGTNTFGSDETQVSITNNGQILVDPNETSAEIVNSNLKMTGAGNTTVEGNKTLTIRSSKVVPVGNQQIFVEANGTLNTDGAEVDLSGCNVRYIVLKEKAELGEKADLDLKNSTFNNSPKLGVIRANGSNKINIEGSTFENNIANGGAYPQEFGGVLVVEKASDVTIKGSTFIGNQASKNGGAIYQNGGTLTISGASEFKNNTAMTINGGAVYFVGGENNKLTIDDGVSFTGNTAEKGYGGAVYSKAPTEVKAATFEENTAKRGGAVYICNGKDSVVDGATFKNNTAIDSDNGGGAIAVGIDGSDNGADSVTVNKSTFTDNTAKDGGAIAIKDTKKFTIDDESTFEGNNAQRGGAIYINGVENATVGEAAFTRNGLREGQDYGAQDAGAIFIESANGKTKVTLNGTIFEENVVYGPASSSGGAIYVRAGTGAYKFDECNLYVNGAKFTNNTAGLYGGAMTVAHGARAYISDLDGDPTEFKGNIVPFATDHAGGGLFINQGYVHMDDVAIYNNYAKSGGGGISSCTKGAAEAKVLGGAAIFNNHVGSDGADPQLDDYALVHENAESYPDIFFETKDHLNRETGEQIREWEIWPIELYERMFNGGLHKWDAKPFDGIKIHDSLPLNSFMAKSNPTNTDISGAKVVFTENVANSVGAWKATGGAIGCNGLLEMGTGTEIKIVKVWDDARDNDGYRPDMDEKFIDNLIVKANGEPIDIKTEPVKTQIVNIKDFDPAALANNIVNMTDPQKDFSDYDAWVVVISGLALLGEDGRQIRYTVEEKDQEYYSLIENIGGNETYFEMKNRHNLDLVKITATKEWDDADDNDGKRPESITIKLLADGEEIDEKTATEAEDWMVTFEDLPRFKDGVEIAYTVSEVSVDQYKNNVELIRDEETGREDQTEETNNGETNNSDEELDNDKIEELDQPINTEPKVEQIVVEKDFLITNTHEPGTSTVEVTKVWEDKEDKDAIRPTSVVIRLLADGKETGDTLVLREADAWKGSFSNLPEYIAGKKIEYTVSEDPVPGYKTEITGDAESGFTVTNSHTPTPELPEVKKTVDVEELTTMTGTGGRASYTIETIIPSDTVLFIVRDELVEELTYESKENEVVVTVDGKVFTDAEVEIDGQDLYVTFNEEQILAHVGETVTVSFRAKVRDGADVSKYRVDGKVMIPNTAWYELVNNAGEEMKQESNTVRFTPPTPNKTPVPEKTPVPKKAVPVKTPKKATSAKTGDASQSALFSVVFSASLLAIVFLATGRARRKRH